jgi:hypothetical protein
MYSVIKFICLRDQFGDTLNYKDKLYDVVRYLSYRYICKCFVVGCDIAQSVIRLITYSI